MRARVWLFALLVSLLPAGVSAATFDVDPAHTFVSFRVKHLGITNAWGRFNEVSGTVSFDDADPTRSSVSLTVQASSVDTNEPKRDKHLRSPDFFNAKQFPTLNFESTAVEKKGPDLYQVVGDLSAHGVTRSVTVEFRFHGEAQDSSGNTKAGGETTFTILRSDFGMKYGIPAIGDEVQITVAVEGYKK